MLDGPLGQLVSAAVTSMATGMVIIEAPSGRIVFRNAEADRLFGSALAVAPRFRDLDGQLSYHAGGVRLDPEQWPILRALRGELLVNQPVELERRDGERRILAVTSAPVRDEKGQVVAAVSTYYDLTEKQREHACAAFLVQVNALLERFERDTTLQAIADLAVPALADWCFIHLITPRGVEAAAVAHTDPERLAVARARGASLYELSRDTAVARVLGGGPGELVSVDADVLRRAAVDGAHHAALQTSGYRSAVVAPLAGRDGPMGAVTFVMAESGRQYVAADLDMLCELAKRTGTALENAQLFAAEQQARLAAEQARDRTRCLQQVASALSGTIEKERVMTIVVDAARSALGATAGFAWMLRDADTLEMAAEHEPGRHAHGDKFRTISMRDPAPVCDVVRTGEQLIFENLDAMRARYPAIAAITSFAAWAVTPLIVAGNTIGAAGFVFDTPRTISAEERELLGAMMGQAAIAFERCRLFEANRRGEEQLRMALTAARAATWSIDIASNISRRDPGYAELVGQYAASVAADFGSIHPEDRDVARAAYAKTLATGVPYEPEVRLRRDDGTYMWVRSHGRLIYRDGKPVTLAGVIVDIDDAKQSSLRAEEERRINETLHRLARSFASELDETRLLRLITEEIATLLGAEVATFERPDGESITWGQAVLHQALRDGRVSSLCRIPVIARNGEVFGTLLLGHSEPTRFRDDQLQLASSIANQAAIALDNAHLYTTVREHKNQLEEAVERARVADRRKDEFLAMLSHELRNPLAPITTALDLMRIRGVTEGTKERDVIRRQVIHLSRLIDDLLDVSRITGGKITLSRSVLELSNVVARAVETVSPLLERRSHRLRIDVPSTGLLVDADVVRLAQVLQNLLVNAAKYSEPRTVIELDAFARGDEAVIQIRDSGIGISAELLPRVFDLFVQGERALDRSEGGLGIGLAIARSLCELHGGRISASSAGAGKGSTFEIALPRAVASQMPADVDTPVSLARALEQTGRRMRVLVVDDNVDAAMMLHDFLGALGHESVVAHDGPAALELVASFQPDVAVLDIGLPVMNGYELARRLRESLGPDRLRLIALTGYGQEADRAKAREVGFDHHLVKPVDLDSLLPLLAK